MNFSEIESLYRTYESVEKNFTPKQQEYILDKLCEDLVSKGYDWDTAEANVYGHKLFYSLAQSLPVEERVPFFYQLVTQSLTGPVAVSLLKNEETGNREAKIMDIFNKED